MIAATTTWAAGTLITKVAVDRTTLRPSAVLTVQLATSVMFLTLIAAVRHQLPRMETSLWRRGSSGLLEPALSYQLFIAGLAFTSAGHASLIGAAEPLLVPFGAWLLYRQRPSRALFVLVAVVAGGSVLLVGGAGGGSIKGDLLVLAGTVSAASYVVVSSRSVAFTAPLTLALVQQIIALAATAAIASLIAVASGGVGHERAPTLLVIALSGIVMTALPFPLYLSALRHLDAAVAAQYVALIPVFGLGGALLFLGETITLIQGVGAIAIIVALAVVARVDVVADRTGTATATATVDSVGGVDGVDGEAHVDEIRSRVGSPLAG